MTFTMRPKGTPLPDNHPFKNGAIIFNMPRPRLATYAAFERSKPQRERFDAEDAYQQALAGWQLQLTRMEAVARLLGTTLDGVDY
jgi:hypothetical protein